MINVQPFLCGPPPAKGQMQRYPGRFLFYLRKYYPDFFGDNVLHLFSGSCDFGISSDMRAETNSDIVCDFRDIPNIIGQYYKFDAAICDPPYCDQYQNEWGGDLPKPKHILKVCSEVVKPGGLIAILHIIIIPSYKVLGVERIGVHPILAGPNNAMRCLNVFRKL